MVVLCLFLILTKSSNHKTDYLPCRGRGQMRGIRYMHVQIHRSGILSVNHFYIYAETAAKYLTKAAKITFDMKHNTWYNYI